MLLANNNLAKVYDHRPTFTRPAGIRALETVRRYNIEAPMVQACDPYKLPPWLLRKPNYRLDVAGKARNRASQEI